MTFLAVLLLWTDATLFYGKGLSFQNHFWKFRLKNKISTDLGQLVSLSFDGTKQVDGCEARLYQVQGRKYLSWDI